jgi:hypothetical protein
MLVEYPQSQENSCYWLHALDIGCECRVHGCNICNDSARGGAVTELWLLVKVKGSQRTCFADASKRCWYGGNLLSVGGLLYDGGVEI